MPGYVHDPSPFWVLLELGSAAASWAGPMLLTLVGVLLAKRWPSLWSTLAFFGALLHLAGRTTRALSASVSWITPGGPAPGQSPVELVLFMHASNIGLLLFAVGLTGAVMRMRRANAA